MNYLGIDVDELKSIGGFDTAKEIASQPEMWLKTYERVMEEKDELSRFMAKALDEGGACVILTGAGTSAFIGEALAGMYQKKLQISARSIATTDIITHPENYFIRSKPTLLISFARSGDSPESLATVKLADEHCDHLYQLIITCNRTGDLATRARSDNTYVFLLPEETNDKSLAMTSSFSSMLLAALLILKIRDHEDLLPVIENLSACGNHVLNVGLAQLKSIATLEFSRAVFLGSGPLFGVAHESHLKVQELSDGQVVGKFDTYLGFRHGPRAIVDKSTLIGYLISSDDHVKKYEIDLIRSINESTAGAKSLSIGNGIDTQELKIDYTIGFPASIKELPDDFYTVLYILPAQIIGFLKSLNLGLEPDSPSVGGSISRVVQGVTIY